MNRNLLPKYHFCIRRTARKTGRENTHNRELITIKNKRQQILSELEKFEGI